MAHVRIPTVLRKHTDGQARLEAPGATVREVFEDVTRRHPELASKLFDGDAVRGFINVYVDDEDIRFLDGLDSSVTADDEIAIMPAVAGGAEPRDPAVMADGGGGGEHARRARSAGGAQVTGRG